MFVLIPVSFLCWFLFPHMRTALYCWINKGLISAQAVEVIEGESGLQDSRLQNQRTEAFLSLARFSDAQYQSIDKYMNSSEFENKQALLEKAKEEVGLIKEHKVTSNRLICTFTARCIAFKLRSSYNQRKSEGLFPACLCPNSQVHNKSAKRAGAGWKSPVQPADGQKALSV